MSLQRGLIRAWRMQIFLIPVDREAEKTLNNGILKPVEENMCQGKLIIIYGAQNFGVTLNLECLTGGNYKDLFSVSDSDMLGCIPFFSI